MMASDRLITAVYDGVCAGQDVTSVATDRDALKIAQMVLLASRRPTAAQYQAAAEAEFQHLYPGRKMTEVAWRGTPCMQFVAMYSAAIDELLTTLGSKK